MFYESMHFFIHSYPGAVLGFLFVTGLAEKLYKILHALSVGFSEMLAVPHRQQAKKSKYPQNEKISRFFQKYTKFLSWGVIKFLS
ncbi:hypothetical protein MRBLBA71_001721 [Bacillus nitratireducens]